MAPPLKYFTVSLAEFGWVFEQKILTIITMWISNIISKERNLKLLSCIILITNGCHQMT